MKKAVLNFDYNYDYQIIGICCHLKDYRIAWLINKVLNLNLIKQQDHTLTNNNDTTNSFSIYSDRNLEHETAYYLVANKSSGKLLIPEKKVFDYFFILENLSEFDGLFEEIYDKLKAEKAVITISSIIFDELKNKQNIIFE